MEWMCTVSKGFGERFLCLSKEGTIKERGGVGKIGALSVFTSISMGNGMEVLR